jgi:N-acetyl-anhydromuramyl-L-alanine amidase AmpD
MTNWLQRARIGLLPFCISVSAVACSSAPADDRANVQTDLGTGPLASAFTRSAERADVPRDLLVAIAKVEDGLSMPARREELDVDNDVPVAGPLQLRRGKLDTLARAARLSGASEIELRTDADLALEAGALVLAELGKKTGATAGDLASWSKAVEEMGGFGDDAHREKYVHDVYATLARGGTFEGRDGETIVLGAHRELPPSLTIDVSFKVKKLAGAQYPGAEWFPTSCTNKCQTSRGGAAVEFVLVHDTEGGWNASVATLQNDPGKSVQYIIDIDGRVGQFVTEETLAWHSGNSHYNARSVGIEHVGYSTKPYPEAEYAASAKLVEHLTTKYKIPRDRAHIIGHDQVPNGNKIAASSAPCSASPKQCQSNTSYGGASHHTDPGVWEWAVYMQRFGGTAKCNDATEIWNCSNDKAHAFRCAGGVVEVNACTGGCTVMPNGVDDVCTVQPQSAAPPMTEDPVRPPTGDVGDTEPREALPLKSATMPESAEANGCSTSGRSGRGSASPMAFLVALGAVVGAVARRRRH